MLHYGRLLRILNCCISQTMPNALAEVELTSAQGHIMGYLARCKQPPCPKDVEEEFHLSHPTVSGLLSRLEKKDFIALRPDPEDKRCKRIFIQPKGWECNEKMYRTILDNEAHIVNGFSEEEKTQFRELLIRAIRNIGCEPDFQIQEEETDQ